MRKKIAAGNWKMNTNLQSGLKLAKEIDKLVNEQGKEDVSVIIAPPFVSISEIAQTVNFKRISVAAQNCASEEKGAYTGEISAEMVKTTGANYVIIGHSERRSYYKEDNGILSKKVSLALKNALRPIYCCGESLEEREADKHFDIIKRQIEEGIFHLDAENFKKVIVAYEPVWAIGTGKTATSEQAQEMHAFIRKTIADKYGIEVANEISILYGGSVNPKNAKELFANDDVDGGLIGGASLKAEDFIQIINSFE